MHDNKTAPSWRICTAAIPSEGNVYCKLADILQQQAGSVTHGHRVDPSSAGCLGAGVRVGGRAHKSTPAPSGAGGEVLGPWCGRGGSSMLFRVLCFIRSGYEPNRTEK